MPSLVIRGASLPGPVGWWDRARWGDGASGSGRPLQRPLACQPCRGCDHRSPTRPASRELEPLLLTPGTDLHTALTVLPRPRGERATTLTGDHEILCLAGSLSAVGAHLHLSVADANGRVTGGHLREDSPVRTTAEWMVVIASIGAGESRHLPAPLHGMARRHVHANESPWRLISFLFAALASLDAALQDRLRDAQPPEAIVASVADHGYLITVQQLSIFSSRLNGDHGIWARKGDDWREVSSPMSASWTCRRPEP